MTENTVECRIVGSQGECMGRELKRVSLDFDWPLDTVYGGYLNPNRYADPCLHCQESGLSPRALDLQGQWYGTTPFVPRVSGSTPWPSDHPTIVRMARIHVENEGWFYGHGEAAIAREAQRLADHFNSRWAHHLSDDDVLAHIAVGHMTEFTHMRDEQGKRHPLPYVVPSAHEVNEFYLGSMFGPRDRVAIRAVCEREAEDFYCQHCQGEGHTWPSEDVRLEYENWERTDPPRGPGYQLWQTISEGSPISPVFATAIELATWMSANPWGADKNLGVDEWMAFIEGPGWAPTISIEVQSASNSRGTTA